jgi:hypothetical protein
LYDATLIIGATNAPEVLDVGQLRPGTLIVDDSAPHCFTLPLAIERAQRQRDILYTEGGVLRAPEPLRQVRYVPRLLEDTLDQTLLRSFEPSDPHEITGCILSSILSARIEHLTPTIGLVDAKRALDDYRALEDLGFEAGALRCEAHVLANEYVSAFKTRFGGVLG